MKIWQVPVESRKVREPRAGKLKSKMPGHGSSIQAQGAKGEPTLRRQELRKFRHKYAAFLSKQIAGLARAQESGNTGGSVIGELRHELFAGFSVCHGGSAHAGGD